MGAWEGEGNQNEVLGESEAGVSEEDETEGDSGLQKRHNSLELTMSEISILSQQIN